MIDTSSQSLHVSATWSADSLATRKIPIAALALWLVAMVSGATAQQPFQQQSPMRLGQHRIVSQPSLQTPPPAIERAGVRVPADIEQIQSTVQPTTTGSIIDAVRRTDYQSQLPQHNSPNPPPRDWQGVLDSGSAVADGSGAAASQSFIEREKTSGKVQPGPAQDLITKIGINLGFVLAIAIGFILLAKQWQKGKLAPPTTVSEEKPEALCVRQSLRLTGGVSLHVVEGFSHQFLVAIDSGGIKSVKVLGPSFAETLEHADLAQQQLATDYQAADPPNILSARIPIASERAHTAVAAKPAATAAAHTSRLTEQESSTEIDEKLIKLLLRSSQNAA